jgi:hypothetical protein
VELYLAVYQFCFEDLLPYIRAIIKENIDNTNVFQIINIAEIYNDSSLTISCAYFIRYGLVFDQVLKCDDFIKLSSQMKNLILNSK